jgi:cyclin-dependent kinase 12/13
LIEVRSRFLINSEVPARKSDVYLVFEYMEHDLHGILDKSPDFTVPQIKCLMKQLLLGIKYLHEENIMHRDIKGANLLLNNDGVLKLADFGLSRRTYTNPTHFTNRVCTLWYRPPELLLGTINYGPSIDIWSIGCFFSELLSNKPLFPTDNEQKQISLIFDKCGFPTEDTWPGVSALPNYSKLEKTNSNYKLRDLFSTYSK